MKFILVMPPILPESAIIAFMGGYILHIMAEWDFCGECIERLQQEKSMSSFLTYIRLLGIS